MQTQKHITDRSGIMLKYLAEALEGIYGSSAMGTTVLTEAASDGQDDLVAEAKRPLPINTGLSTVYAASKAAADGRIGTRSIQDFNLNLNDKLTTLFRNAHYSGGSYPSDTNALRIKLLKLFPDDVSQDGSTPDLEVKLDDEAIGVADIGEYVDTIVQYTNTSFVKWFSNLVAGSLNQPEYSVDDLGGSISLKFNKHDIGSLDDATVEDRSLFVHFYTTIQLTKLESEILKFKPFASKDDGDALRQLIYRISSLIIALSNLHMVLCIKSPGLNYPVVRQASSFLGGFSISNIVGSVDIGAVSSGVAVNLIKKVIQEVSKLEDGDANALKIVEAGKEVFSSDTPLTITDIDKIEAETVPLTWSNETLVKKMFSTMFDEIMASEHPSNKMHSSFHAVADKADVALAVAEISKLTRLETPPATNDTNTSAGSKPISSGNQIANFYQVVSRSFKKQDGKESLKSITPQVRAQIIKLCSPVLSFIGSFNKHVIRGAYGMHVIDHYALSSITTGESARLNQKSKPDPAKLKDDLTSLVVHYEYALLRNRKDFVIESVYPIANPKPEAKADSVLIGVRFPCFAPTADQVNTAQGITSTTRWLRVVFVLSPHAVRSANGKNAQATVSSAQVKDALFYAVSKSGSSYVPLISKAQLGSLITHNISERLKNGSDKLSADHKDYLHVYKYDTSKTHRENTTDMINGAYLASQDRSKMSPVEKTQSNEAMNKVKAKTVAAGDDALKTLTDHSVSSFIGNLNRDEQDISNIPDPSTTVRELSKHVADATKTLRGMIPVHSNMFLNIHSAGNKANTKKALVDLAAQQLSDSGLNTKAFDITCEEAEVPGSDITAFKTVSKLKEGVVFTDTDKVLSDTLSNARDIVLPSDVLQSPDANDVDATDELLLTLARHKGVKVPTEDGPKKIKLNKAWRGHVATSDEEFENDKALAQNDAQKNAFEVVSEVRKLHAGMKKFFDTMNYLQIYSHLDTYYALADRDPSELHLSYAEDHNGLLTLNVEVLEAVVAVFTDAASKHKPSENIVINILIKAVKEVLAIVKHLLGNKLWFDRNEEERKRQCTNLVNLAKVIDWVRGLESVDDVKNLVLSNLKQFQQEFRLQSFTVIPNVDENYNTSDGSLHVKTCSAITGNTDALELEPSIEEHGASITMAYAKSKKKHPVIVKNMASVLLPLEFPEASTSFTEVNAGVSSNTSTNGTELDLVKADVNTILNNMVSLSLHEKLLETAAETVKTVINTYNSPVKDVKIGKDAYKRYGALVETIEASRKFENPDYLRPSTIVDAIGGIKSIKVSSDVQSFPDTKDPTGKTVKGGKYTSILVNVLSTADTVSELKSNKTVDGRDTDISFVYPGIHPDQNKAYLMTKVGKDGDWKGNENGVDAINEISNILVQSKPGASKYLQVLTSVYIAVNAITQKKDGFNIKLLILDRINVETGRVEFSSVSYRSNSYYITPTDMIGNVEKYMTPIADLEPGKENGQKKMTMSYALPLTEDNAVKLMLRALFSLSVDKAKEMSDKLDNKAITSGQILPGSANVMKHYDGFDDNAISKNLNSAKEAYKKAPPNIRREVSEPATPFSIKAMSSITDAINHASSGRSKKES